VSIHRRAARRDDNEAAIIAVLLAAGASVTRLNGSGETPTVVDGKARTIYGGETDLLVGIAGRTLLIEVKRERGPRGGKRGGGRSRPGMGGDGELTADQIAWRAAWKGSPPVIVRTPDEALAAIGARTMTPWIAVTDRLPDHGQTVLVWFGITDIATFQQRHVVWEHEDRATASSSPGMEGMAEEDIDRLWPNEPYFSWSGGDCETTWRASRAFAADGDEESYGWSPPITHWMPLPERP
jgi:hypothetical protein